MSTVLFESEALLDQAKQLREAKKYGEAESALKDALLKRKSVVGEKDQSIAQINDELGEVCLLSGKTDEAVKYFETAISTFEAVFYAGHYRIAPVLTHLVDAYLKQDKYAEAEPVCQRALEIYDKTLSAEHRQTLETTVKLARIQIKLGKYAEAEKLLTKAQKQVDSPLGPLEDFQFMLAEINEQNGKTDEADKFYKSAIEGFEQRRSYPALVTCLRRYAEFLKKQNRKDDAAKTEEQAVKYADFSKSWQHSDDIFVATLLRA
jgi:tetratricopeptide (TPR) repeat protein